MAVAGEKPMAVDIDWSTYIGYGIENGIDRPQTQEVADLARLAELLRSPATVASDAGGGGRVPRYLP